MEIKSYRIIWEIDIDAADPKSAAEEALDSIVNGSSKVFEVHEYTGEGNYEPIAYVDLDDDDDPIVNSKPSPRKF